MRCAVASRCALCLPDAPLFPQSHNALCAAALLPPPCACRLSTAPAATGLQHQAASTRSSSQPWAVCRCARASPERCMCARSSARVCVPACAHARRGGVCSHRSCAVTTRCMLGRAAPDRRRCLAGPSPPPPSCCTSPPSTSSLHALHTSTVRVPCAAACALRLFCVTAAAVMIAAAPLVARGSIRAAQGCRACRPGCEQHKRLYCSFGLASQHCLVCLCSCWPAAGLASRVPTIHSILLAAVVGPLGLLSHQLTKVRHLVMHV